MRSFSIKRRIVIAVVATELVLGRVSALSRHFRDAIACDPIIRHGTSWTGSGN